MKFYDFVEKAPKIDGLVVIEGVEPLLAQRAIDIILERTLPEDMRSLNLDTFTEFPADGARRIADSVTAMPFLAERRVTVVRNAQTYRAQQRRDVWAVVEQIPKGNTLVLEDLLSPARKVKPEPFGVMAGRAALRIDTTPNAEVRERFVRETLHALHAQAEPRVIAELAQSESDLGAIRNDLEKLSLEGRRITYADLAAESLAVEDPKAWQYASALLDGRAGEALEIAFDLFANDPRGAAIPLASALAREFALVWELARPGGGNLPPRDRWRERAIRPIANRIGERRARFAYESAVRGFEAVVTGRIEDPRAMIEILTAEIAGRVIR